MGMPVIFIDADPNPKRFDSIVVDYRRAVEEIVSYLVGCGHTKIGMIGCREVDKEGMKYWIREYSIFRTL